jgi:hypothetical protein
MVICSIRKEKKDKKGKNKGYTGKLGSETKNNNRP